MNDPFVETAMALLGLAPPADPGARPAARAGSDALLEGAKPAGARPRDSR